MFNLFKKSYSKAEMDQFEFLSKVKLFSKLTNAEMAFFLPYTYERDYVSDEVVFFRGDPSNALYIIKSGEVNLNIDLNEGIEQLTRLTVRESFGDNVFLPDTKRIYNAIVQSEKAKIIVIPKINSMDIFEAHPVVMSKILSSMAEMYNEYTENLFAAYKSSFGFFNLGDAYIRDEIKSR